jgi:hypothetical protein
MGLLIPRCPSVHTVGMRFAIDVAFVHWPAPDGRVTVLDLTPQLPPWRLTHLRRRGRGVPRKQVAALELAAPGGRVNFFAGLPRDGSRVELDTNLIHYKELLVTGTTACTTEDCREALELVLSGAVDTAQLVTARRPLAEAAEAFAAARSGEQLKVVVEP